MQEIKVHIKGRLPLIVHNERLANPLNEYARRLAEVTKKLRKTLDDHKLIAKLEFEGGIYCDPKIGPFVPRSWLLKAIENGAKKEKLGKTIRAALFMEQEQIPLIYAGPRKIDELYKAGFFDQRCVRVSTSKTVRTRPLFNDWELKFEAEFDETLVDAAQIKRAIAHAGKVEGIGDYRPRYGTFTLESFT